MLYFTCNKLGILKFNRLKKHYLIATKGNAFLITWRNLSSVEGGNKSDYYCFLLLCRSSNQWSNSDFTISTRIGATTKVKNSFNRLTSFQGEAIVAEIIITNLTYIICRKNRENSMLTPKLTPILKIRYDQSELKSLFLGTSY